MIRDPDGIAVRETRLGLRELAKLTQPPVPRSHWRPVTAASVTVESRVTSGVTPGHRGTQHCQAGPSLFYWAEAAGPGDPALMVTIHESTLQLETKPRFRVRVSLPSQLVLCNSDQPEVPSPTMALAAGLRFGLVGDSQPARSTSLAGGPKLLRSSGGRDAGGPGRRRARPGRGRCLPGPSPGSSGGSGPCMSRPP